MHKLTIGCKKRSQMPCIPQNLSKTVCNRRDQSGQFYLTPLCQVNLTVKARPGHPLSR